MKKEQIKLLTYHVIGVIIVVAVIIVTKEPAWAFATILLVVATLFTILNKKG